MIAFIYRCPRTGQQVQGWAADHLAKGETYEPVTCTGCGRIHLVNSKTGKVLETGKKIALQPRVINSGSLAIFAAIRRASFVHEQLAAMSALPPKADIVQHGGSVRFVPQADIG